MSGAPQISVIIPTRDRLAQLQDAALPAALMQEAVDIELIIVDDGSETEMQSALRTQDARVRVVRHPTSRGVAAARNTGLHHARGKWIAFLDDDDIWAPGKLRAQLDAATEARADFAYSSALIVDQRLQVLSGLPAPRADRLSHLLRTRDAMPAGASNVLVRSNTLRAIGGFDTTIPASADWDCWIRLAEATSGCSCREYHVAWVFHATNMHVRTPTASSDYRHVHAKHGIGIRRLAGSEVMASRARAFAFRRQGRRRDASREYLISAVRSRSVTQLVRAGVVLLGERAMSLGAGRRGWTDADVAWLNRYRSAQ